ITARSQAQFLVDQALRSHPEVEVIALHARTPQTGEGFPIVASNIGRIGKPADEGDLAAIRTGKAQVQADEKGARLEAKVPVKDRSGATVGALGVVFPYRSGADVARLQQQAEKIAAEIGQGIASADKLDDPYPAQAVLARTDANEQYNKQELGNRQDLPMTKEVASGAALGQTQEGDADAIKNQAGVQATNSAGSSNDASSI